MKFTDILKEANHNLFQNKIRTFLTILAVFIGSFTIILNSSINTGVNAFIDKQVEGYGGEGYMLITASEETISSTSLTGSSEITEYKEGSSGVESLSLSAEDVKKISQIDGVNSAEPMYMLDVSYITSDKTDKKYNISAQNLASNTIDIDMEFGRNVNINGETAEIIIPEGYASVLGYSNEEDIIGQTITLATPEYLKCSISNDKSGCLTKISATVVGIQAPGVISTGTAWVNTKLKNQIWDAYTKNMPESFSEQFVSVTADVDPDKIEQVKSELKNLGYSGMDVNDIVGMIKTFFDVILIVLTIFGVIALLAAAIGIVNTLFMSVQERTREIGLSKALGMSNSKIFLSFSLEAILLGFWGSAIGIATSMIVGKIANVVAINTFLSDFPTFELTKFDPLNMLVITLIIMSIAFLAGTIPAIKASRKNPIDSLRYE